MLDAMRLALASSLAINAAALALLAAVHHGALPRRDTPDPIEIELVEPAVSSTPVAAPRMAGAPGGAPGRARLARPASHRAERDPWANVAIRVEHAGDGNGGHGHGHGGGIGIGDGGGIATPQPLPATPPPPPVSLRRAAKLVWPTRDEDVEDGHLFVARVTIDDHGDVVGARMIATQPGSRGDQAASAIWTFRYAPALDDAGQPIRSTFDQEFQIR